jgi:hypothetical protein
MGLRHQRAVRRNRRPGRRVHQFVERRQSCRPRHGARRHRGSGGHAVTGGQATVALDCHYLVVHRRCQAPSARAQKKPHASWAQARQRGAPRAWGAIYKRASTLTRPGRFVPCGRDWLRRAAPGIDSVYRADLDQAFNLADHPQDAIRVRTNDYAVAIQKAQGVGTLEGKPMIRPSEATGASQTLLTPRHAAIVIRQSPPGHL